ncbi:MAG: hypothetical protein ACLRR6_02105 [Oscillospiraceae bacterium]
MKTEELTALGLNEDQVKQVFALNGKDVEAAKAAKDKTIADLTAERDGLKTRLDTAETTLKKFEGIDPQQIQQEIRPTRRRRRTRRRNSPARSRSAIRRTGSPRSWTSTASLLPLPARPLCPSVCLRTPV